MSLSLSQEMLFKLLDSSIGEEKYATEAHQKSTQFYSSFISAALAATIAGAMSAKSAVHLVFLLVGPLLVVLVAALAIRASWRINQRFIEAIVVRAKLERELGMCDSPFGGPNREGGRKANYWRGEPLVAARHLRARLASKSSEEFVSIHLRHGLHAPARKLYVVFIAIGLALASGLIALAILGAQQV